MGLSEAPIYSSGPNCLDITFYDLATGIKLEGFLVSILELLGARSDKLI